MALNYNDQTFFELNEAQFAACRLIRSQLYLCDTSVLTTMNFTTCFLLGILYNRTDPQNCDHTEIAINGVLWQKLILPNTWLFSADQTTYVAVICNEQREDFTLSGSGILHLDEGCIIRTPA